MQAAALRPELLLLTVVITAPVAAGCTSAEERACEALQALVARAEGEPEPLSADECEAMMSELEDACENGDEILECIAGVGSSAGLLDCTASCKEVR